MSKKTILLTTILCTSYIGSAIATNLTQQEKERILFEQWVLKEAIKEGKIPALPKELLDKIAVMRMNITPSLRCPKVEDIKNALQAVQQEPLWSTLNPKIYPIRIGGAIFTAGLTEFPNFTDAQTRAAIMTRGQQLNQFHAIYVTPTSITCSYNVPGGPGLSLTFDLKSMGIDRNSLKIPKEELFSTASGYGWTSSPNFEIAH